MKKMFLLYFLACLSINLDVYCQSFTYEYSYNLDSTDIGNTKRDLFKLEIYENASLFYSINRVIKNQFASKENPQVINGSIDMTNIPKSGLGFSIKNEPNKNILIEFNDYFVYKFKYIDSVNLNWSIKDEFKEYGSLKAFKATLEFRGRNYIAWFTNEIPLPYGPYKFFALPGLIVEVYDEKKYHHFKLITNQEFKISPNYFENYQLISREEFLQFKEKYENDPMSLMPVESGISIPNDQKAIYKERMRKRKKRRNNPIELTDK